MKSRTQVLAQISKLMLIVMLVIGQIAVALPVQANNTSATYYVDNNGEDTNDGSKQSPFKTIDAALEAIKDNLTITEGTIELLSNIELSTTLVINNGAKKVTLTSQNEKSIIRHENFNDGHLIDILNSNVILQQIKVDGNQVAVTRGHGIFIRSGAKAEIVDVDILNHHIKSGAGTSVISTNGAGTITKISGQTLITTNKIDAYTKDNPSSVLGAGSGGRLEITNGLVTKNTIVANSNGVIIGLGMAGNPSFKMTGGKIAENNLNGTELADNKTIGNVAVFMRGTAAQARFEFGGTAYVYDNLNTNNEQRNVYLNNTSATDTAYLSLIAKMDEGAKVGVYANIMPTQASPIVDVAKGYNSYVVSEDDAKVFYSDKTTAAMVKFEDDKVILTPIPPKFTSATLDKTIVDGKDIILTFTDDISITDFTGFTLTEGGQAITPKSHNVKGNQLIITLEDEPQADLSLIYDASIGNLKGTNGTTVEDFEQTIENTFVKALTINQPHATTTQIKPEIKGTVEKGSTVNVVLKDNKGVTLTGAGGQAIVDADGNWIYTPPNDLPIGEYIIEVTAQKANQQAVTSKKFTITDVDKVALQDKVTEGKGLNASTYTTSSWSAYKKALDEAQVVLANANATQVEVDVALAKLQEAQHKLTKVSTGGGSIIPPTPKPDTSKDITIAVEIEEGNETTNNQLKGKREVDQDGKIHDTLQLSQEVINELKDNSGTNQATARFIIPKDAGEFTLTFTEDGLSVLKTSGLTLEVVTSAGNVHVPAKEVSQLPSDYYLHVMPIKQEAAKVAMEDQLYNDKTVQALQGDFITLQGEPLKIDTNHNGSVVVTLPVKTTNLPKDGDIKAYVSSVAIYMQKANGETQIIYPKVVQQTDGTYALQFETDGASTIALFQYKKPQVGQHEWYIKGFTDGKFKPEANVTRAQVALMIARNLQYAEMPVEQSPFIDVATDYHAASAIAFVKERGIMNGDITGEFHPQSPMTRAQLAKVVANYKKLTIKESGDLYFTDTSQHWAKWIIEANREAGIITGFTDGTFRPQGNITRAQAVKMMNRMFERGPLYGIKIATFPDMPIEHWAFEEVEEAASTHYYYIDSDHKEKPVH